MTQTAQTSTRAVLTAEHLVLESVKHFVGDLYQFTFRDPAGNPMQSKTVLIGDDAIRQARSLVGKRFTMTLAEEE